MDVVVESSWIPFDDIVRAFEYCMKAVGGTGAIYYIGKIGKWFVRPDKERNINNQDHQEG